MNRSYLLILLHAFSLGASSEKLGWTPWQSPDFHNNLVKVQKDLAAAEEFRKISEEKELRKKEKKERFALQKTESRLQKEVELQKQKKDSEQERLTQAKLRKEAIVLAQLKNKKK